MNCVMPYLDRPDATIFFDTQGPREGSQEGSQEGPWVTLVNGHTRTSSDFKMMARYLEDRGFRVLMLDNRGSGKSQARADFDLEDMVADIVAIWDHLDVRRSHVLGITMGGMIAQWLAGKFPERIDRLVLVSTAPNRGYIRDHGSYAWSGDEKAVEAKLATYFSPGFLAANKPLVTAMAKQMAKAAREGTFIGDSARQMRAMEGFDAKSLLGAIKAPVLLIHGKEDVIVPPVAVDALASGLRDSRISWFDGAGHLLLAERPKELYEQVGRFFSGLMA